MNEYEYVTRLRKEFKRQGIKTYKLSASTAGEVGAPDIFGVYAGVPFFIEAKYGDKYGATKKQVYELREWMAAGAVSLLLNGLYTPVFNVVTAVKEVIDLIKEDNFTASGAELSALVVKSLMLKSKQT